MPFVPCPVHVHRPESAFQPTRTLLNNYVGIRPMSSVEERAKGFPPRWLPTTALSVGIIPCVRLGSPSPNITSESDTPQLSILGRFPIHNENMHRPAPSNVTPSPPPPNVGSRFNGPQLAKPQKSPQRRHHPHPRPVSVHANLTCLLRSSLGWGGVSAGPPGGWSSSHSC